MKTAVRRVALAYSGGLDASIIIPWLKETYDCAVVAVAVDVGQGGELAGLKEKALATGASEFHQIDAREEFVAEYLFPVLKAGAVYEKDYLLGTATARPLIAKKQVEVALATRCDALAHGCTGKGNDQVRFELAYQALAPDLHVIAPWREWDLRSREDCIDFAAKRGISVPVTKKEPYSRDRNLWHLSHEGGPLEDPAAEPESSMFRRSVSPESAPDTPEHVAITFEAGVPACVNGERLRPAALVEALNTIGGRHGVGRADIVENRLIGIKSRGVYETPGGTLLVRALEAVESVTLDRDSAHEKERLALRYAELVYFGQWFSPLKEAIDAFVGTLAADVTGTATLKLYKGSATVVGRSAPRSLYSADLASFDMSGYSSADSAGFIRLFGLPTKGRKRLTPKPTPQRAYDEEAAAARTFAPISADPHGQAPVSEPAAVGASLTSPSASRGSPRAVRRTS